MANRWALDTNIYIKALRDRQALADLKRFRLRARARLLVSAVVALELRAATLTEAHAGAVDDLVKTYADRGRVVTPSFAAFLEASRVLSALATKERLPIADAPRSLV